jgi:hypothetical protein
MRGAPAGRLNGLMNEAYITGTGAFLPGDAVDNEQLATRFGADTPRAAQLRSRTLAANGIKTRHYAVDESGMTVMLNEELAAEAARRALTDRGLSPRSVSMLATGTTQGDLLVPGFASMVHGRLGGGPMELLSAAGVCASGMAALKAAVSAVRLGEHPVAVAVGSELVSRSLGASVPDTPDTIFMSRVTVTLIVAAKRTCPIRFSAHATMDRMCLWFPRRFVSAGQRKRYTGAGSSARIWKPPFSRGPACSRPPSADTRSRMPIRPSPGPAEVLTAPFPSSSTCTVRALCA